MRSVTRHILCWIMPLHAAQAMPPPHRPNLVVIGRFENLDYAPLVDPSDVLGHGWVTARLRISRVIRGHAPLRTVTIRYLAHSFRNGERPVRLKLRAVSPGVYLVCATPGGIGLKCD